MKLMRVPYNTDKMYIHTSMYDVAVYKVRFWDLLRKAYPEFENMLNKVEYKTLYAIFCYKDGITRFSFEETENTYDDRTHSMELNLEHFEDKVNRLIRRYLKENTS